MSASSSPSNNRQQWAVWLMGVGVIAGLGSIPLMQWDLRWSQDLRAAGVPGDVRKAIELSEAFAHGSGVTAILVALVLASWPPSRRLWQAIAMTASSGIVANLLKTAFTRARPYTYDTDGTAAATDVTGWEFLGGGNFWDASQRSFPSGHTATAWGLAIGLSLLYPRATIVFLLLACLATYQRIYSGAHFPSDVVAGFGVACLCCGLILWRQRQSSTSSTSTATDLSGEQPSI